MELKKGDVVAVVAEVVAERDGKIIISIPGATVSEDLIIAPRKPIRILERSPSPGDQVLYRNEIPCIFRRNETQTVVSLVRDGMPHDDPTSYLFANIKDIRRLDQSGTVKFVSTERSFPNSETGREAMADLKSDHVEEDTTDAPAASASTPEESVATVRQDGDGGDAMTPVSESAGIEEAVRSAEPVVEGTVLDPHRTATDTADEADGEKAIEQSILTNGEAHAVAQSNVPSAISDPSADEDVVDESDKITIEMPEGFAARSRSDDDAEHAPIASNTEAVEPSSGMIEEEVVRPDPITTEDTSGPTDDHEAPEAPEVIPQESKAGVLDDNKDEEPAPEVEEAASDVEGHDRVTETPATAEMTQEELRERDLRIGKLREETISNLNGDNGVKSETPTPTPAATGSSIFPNLDDLDT